MEEEKKKKKHGEGRRPHLDGETPSGKRDGRRQSECVNKAGVRNNGREQQIEVCVVQKKKKRKKSESACVRN